MYKEVDEDAWNKLVQDYEIEDSTPQPLIDSFVVNCVIGALILLNILFMGITIEAQTYCRRFNTCPFNPYFFAAENFFTTVWVVDGAVLTMGGGGGVGIWWEG